MKGTRLLPLVALFLLPAAAESSASSLDGDWLGGFVRPGRLPLHPNE